MCLVVLFEAAIIGSKIWLSLDSWIVVIKKSPKSRLALKFKNTILNGTGTYLIGLASNPYGYKIIILK